MMFWVKHSLMKYFLLYTSEKNSILSVETEKILCP